MSGKDKKRFALVSAGLVSLALLAVLTYTSVFNAGFVYEDLHFLDVAAQVDSFDCCGRIAELSFLAQDGYSPVAYHTANLGVHLLIGLLVGLWLHNLGLSVSASFIGSAVMLLHPLSVEGVAYISGRSDLVVTLFVVMAAWAVTKRFYMVMILCSVLAAVSKNSGITALALVLLTAITIRRQVLHAIFAMVVAGIIIVNTQLGEQLISLLSWFFNPSLDPQLWFEYQITAVVRIVGMVVSGVGQTPTFDVEQVPQFYRLVSLAWLGSLVVLALVMWRRERLVGAGLLWLLIAVAPRLVMQPPDAFVAVPNYFNEGDFYLALPAAALLVALLWDALSGELKWATLRM